MAEKLTPELQAILDEANSRGSLVDGHPDLKDRSPEAPNPADLPCFSYPNGKPKPDPRSMGPQPQEQSGYSNPIDDPEYQKKFFSDLIPRQENK